MSVHYMNPVFIEGQLELLQHWVFEREAIRMRKEELGKPKPWTQDAVLRTNRFCNVRRMDDKVSRWLLANWYHPMRTAHARVLITMATLARHINWPDTLAELDQYVQRSTPNAEKWQPTRVEAILEQRRARGDKVFTGAYIINGARGGSKVSQVVRTVDAVWNAPYAKPTTMEAMHAELSCIEGIGSFMAGQIVADLRHTHVLDKATDAFTWAPRGPGSTRGMNRLLGRQPLHSSFTNTAWQGYLGSLWGTLHRRPYHRAGAVLRSRQCELMDLQNCLCEFDKYVRVMNGEGRARNRYPGAM